MTNAQNDKRAGFPALSSFVICYSLFFISFSHRGGKSVALTVATDQEACLHKFTQEFFRARGAELPQPSRLRRCETHTRHLTKLGSSARGQVMKLMNRLVMRLVHHSGLLRRVILAVRVPRMVDKIPPFL